MAATTPSVRTHPGLVIPERSKRRLSQALFAFLQTAATTYSPARNPSRQTGISELRRQDVALALDLRTDYYELPDDLEPVLDRVAQTATIHAARFADSRSSSVGVDVANWMRPCAPELDEIGWRRVFIWILGTDSNLANVAILEPPVERDGGLIGTYGYDADGIPGYGVLQVAAAADGFWRICDCWGDAAEADRVDALVSAIRPR